MHLPQRPPHDAAPPALRVFHPAESVESVGSLGVSPRSTLPQFYTGYVAPCILRPEGARPRTFEQYAQSLDFWKQATGDPSLDEIDQRHAAAYVEWLSARTNKRKEPVSPNTVRKHARTVQRCLDMAGPPERSNRHGMGLIPRPVYLPRPRYRAKPAEDVFTLDEIRAWIRAAEKAIAPRLRGVDPPAWWRGLILWTYNTGLRIGTSLAVRWEWIDSQRLAIPGDAYKGGQPRRFVLSAAALAAIEPLRSQPFDRVFPWPYYRTHLDHTRRAMLAAAGFPPARRFGFHGLRKALATALGMVNPAAAQMALGHAAMSTTREHYLHPDILRAALAQIPQP